MKRKFLFNVIVFGLAFIFYNSALTAQPKYDYNWVIASSANGIPGIDAYVIDFNGGKRSLREISAYNIIHDGNAVISNREGELQFYTNGCEFMDTLGGVLINGDTIIPGFVYDSYCDFGVYLGIQNSTILPDPADANQYYYIQKEAIIGPFGQNNSALLLPTLRYSLIQSNDAGAEVIQKSVVIDELGYRFTVCVESIQHANGYDWWIVDYLLEEEGGKRLIYLLDENGISLDRQEDYEHPEALAKFNSTQGQSAFAPNGNIYAKYNAITGLDIFDFNRLTGEFSNYRHFSTLPYDLQKTYSGMAFSPNSRFIYISSHDKLHQLDLWESDLNNGFELIGEYDGFIDPFPTNFTWMQLGPDCRIYMTSTNGVSSYHVIKNPDEKGLDCNFAQHGFELPIHNGTASIPNFPVFRFDEDDICDPTITSVFDIPVEVVHNLELYPNPTSDEVIIGFPEDLRDGVLYVKSMNGQVMLKQEFEYSGSLQVELGDFESGMYIVEVVSDGKRYMDKVVVY